MLPVFFLKQLKITELQWWLPALLAALTLVVFWPALQYPFVNLDDHVFLTGNQHVQGGLSWTAIKWAFSNVEQAAYWAPLMWLSHVITYQIFGPDPWGHHFVNLILHTLNVVLLFFVFRKITGATWRSALLAALFGLHPLRVESVVWVTERKDVLSGLFGMLTLLAYAHYIQIAEKNRRNGLLWYVAALIALGLGLMCKGMLVTIPCVLLLLDYWPLRRIKSSMPPHQTSVLEWFRNSNLTQLILEKVPFFLLAGAGSVVTYVGQKAWGTVPNFDALSLGARCANGIVSYLRYLEKTLWPEKLAIFYPHPGQWPVSAVLWSGLALGMISWASVRTRKRFPFLVVGWLWFLGTLFPVSGIAQSGEQAMADRFTYFPSIGLFIMGVWGAYELMHCYRCNRLSKSVLGTIVIAACVLTTRYQLGYWKDDETLFRRAVQITESNYLAHYILGEALEEKGLLDEAVTEYSQALKIKPGYLYFINTLGVALAKQGRTDEAINQFRAAIQSDPGYVEAIYNLGNVLVATGRLDEAIAQYQEAVRLRPNNFSTRNNLGLAYAMKGEIDNAIHEFQEAVRLNPEFADARNNLEKARSVKAHIKNSAIK